MYLRYIVGISKYIKYIFFFFICDLASLIYVRRFCISYLNMIDRII